MAPQRARHARGQAIVLVALMIVVLFGFVGLAIDGGRGYLDRRELQAAVDAASLASAYNYMNNNSYALAEAAGTAAYANDELLYSVPLCSGYGSLATACSFGDSTGQSLTETLVNSGVVGVTFTVTASHRIPVAVMQVLGSGPTIPIAATATAMARRVGSNGAAIQTLSPTCSGAGTSLTFTGTSTTTVTGDIWSDGGTVDNGGAGGTVNGNSIAICPPMPPVALPTSTWTVTGVQANGWNMPDPNYPPPPLNSVPESWITTNGSTQLPGTYISNVGLTSTSCYFLAGGVYDFAGGFKLNGGFVSNELRPPDEAAMVSAGQPNLTNTTADLSGTINSIAVTALPAAIAGSTSQHSSYVSVGGQTFTVSTSGASAGATSIPLKGSNQTVSGTLPTGSEVSVRAYNQFWDANQSSSDANGCSAVFTPSAVGSDAGNPAVSPQSWSIEMTAVRWSPNGVANCTGPVSPTCYLRESAPSMCKTITTGTSQVIKVQVSGITSPPGPGVQAYNVYLAPNGSCQGPFGYVTNFPNSNNPGVTINGSTLSGWSPATAAAPPDSQGMPLGNNLPNANPPPGTGTPLRGDMANEGHCVDTTTGNNVACPRAYTPGAVTLFIPGPGSNTVCLNLQGGGDIYLFSGYQYSRVLLYEPGPEQAPPANTCSNNVAGSGLTSLVGILYLPAANVTIIGNSSYLATIAGGVIAWTASIKGNGGVSISADPTLRKWPPAVRLTK